MKELQQKEFNARIVKDIGKNKNGHRQAIFACNVCGSEFVKYVNGNRNNKKLSNCPECNKLISIEKRKKIYGDSRSDSKHYRLYSILRGMKSRCNNQTNGAYKYYGGKGITVCDEWSKNYLNFKSWALKNGYTDVLTIDRIDPDKGYFPDNCRWETATVQAANKSCLMATNKSGYRGVSWSPRMSKWEVSIGSKGRSTTIGFYSDRVTAAKAYDTYVLKNSLPHTTNNLVTSSTDYIESNTGQILISTNISGYVGVNSPVRLSKYIRRHSTKVEYLGKNVFSGNYETLEEAAVHRDNFLRSSDLYKKSKKNFSDEEFLLLQIKYKL